MKYRDLVIKTLGTSKVTCSMPSWRFSSAFSWNSLITVRPFLAFKSSTRRSNSSITAPKPCRTACQVSDPADTPCLSISSFSGSSFQDSNTPPMPPLTWSWINLSKSFPRNWIASQSSLYFFSFSSNTTFSTTSQGGAPSPHKKSLTSPLLFTLACSTCATLPVASVRPRSRCSSMLEMTRPSFTRSSCSMACESFLAMYSRTYSLSFAGFSVWVDFKEDRTKSSLTTSGFMAKVWDTLGMMPPADLISSTIISAHAYFSPSVMFMPSEDTPSWM
mmetsp:Transcript_18626/g.44085  ORF Transcript_18626/g.44085 Transcript_18626/m.44085 type:complete len:275 (-) Transcript_18626:1414-2238(-)